MPNQQGREAWRLQNQDDTRIRNSYDGSSYDAMSEEYEQHRHLVREKERYDDPEEDIDSVDFTRPRPSPYTVLLFLGLGISLILVIAAGLSDYVKYSPSSSEAPSSAPDMSMDDSHPVDVHSMPVPLLEQSTSAGPAFSTPSAFPAATSIINYDTIQVPTLTTSTPTTTSQLTGSNDTTPPVPSATNVQDKYLLLSDWDLNAAPTRREYNWSVRDVVHNPDGVYRPMMLINDEYPGPLIEVNEGDTIVVRVTNEAINATSFHWHGMYQSGTNWMDGTVGITQCPIASGRQFTYEFTVNGQSGTYWYHAHQGVQSSDGLYGPLIIHSKDERDLQQLEYATDRIIMLSDYYHDPSNLLLMEYLASDAENSEPVPDGALINGQAIRDCSKLPNRRCDNSTAHVGIPNFNLEAGKRHRLRIINVGAFAEFQLSLDEHDFAVTEVDGTNVLPGYYHRLNILPAQRYSIVVSNNNNNTVPESYWLRAKMLTHCFAEPNPELEPEVWGIVDFGPNENTTYSTPTSQDWPEPIGLECHDLNTTELIPIPAIPAPANADTTIHLRVNFEIGAWRLSRGFFNASSFRANVTHPTLHRAIDGLSSDDNPAWSSAPYASTSTFTNTAAFDPNRELVVQTTGIQVLDLIVTNFDDGSHPLHLHGYKFAVLGQGHGYPPADPVALANLANPLRRDTAAVEAFGWLALRLVADNPGVWAFHCHVAWHAEAGLLMQFLTRSELVREMVVPGPMRGLCEAGEEALRAGMAPEDAVFMREDER